MASTKELREKGAKIAADMRRLVDEGKATTEDGAHSEAWLKANADYNQIRADIDKAKAVDKIMADIEAEQRASVSDPVIGRGSLNLPVSGSDGAETAVTDEQRTLAFAAWARHQLVAAPQSPRPEEVAAARRVGLDPAAKEIVFSPYASRDFRRLQRSFGAGSRSRAHERVVDFRATMSGQSGPAGGYLVPPEDLRRELEVNMLYYGGMMEDSEIITTPTGERMSWPTVDDTTNKGVLLGESGSIGSSVDPTFTKIYWDAYKFSSKPVLVPAELLQDSAFNLATLLGELLGIRLGRVLNDYFTTGTGANQPKGVITAASSFSAASASSIAADDIFGLVHSIDPAYRTQECGFQFHDSILLILRKLKDGIGRYLWQDGMADNAPDRLLSYGTTINQSMDSTVSSGKKTILFGRKRNYKIRRVGEIRMYHLVERYRDTDQDAFVAFLRADGNLLTAGTAPLKYLAH